MRRRGERRRCRVQHRRPHGREAPGRGVEVEVGHDAHVKVVTTPAPAQDASRSIGTARLVAAGGIVTAYCSAPPPSRTRERAQHQQRRAQNRRHAHSSQVAALRASTRDRFRALLPTIPAFSSLRSIHSRTRPYYAATILPATLSLWRSFYSRVIPREFGSRVDRSGGSPSAAATRLLVRAPTAAAPPTPSAQVSCAGALPRRARNRTAPSHRVSLLPPPDCVIRRTFRAFVKQSNGHRP